MSDTRPIGILDSGLGGLTVVKEIQRLMPGERIIYIGDTARGPYGGHSEEIIRRHATEMAEYLMKMDVKMLISSCNTVSSVALEHIERTCKDTPVIGVVLPGARAAVLRTAERKIGVVGTEMTIRSNAYTRAIQSLDSSLKVYGKSCPLFVPIVEEKMLNHDITRVVTQYYLYEMIDLGIDCIILGCSHYPLLMETIQGTVGTRIQLIDSALWTAKEVQDILTALKGFNPEQSGGYKHSRFLVTDMASHTNDQASMFIGMPVTHQLQKISLEGIR